MQSTAIGDRGEQVCCAGEGTVYKPPGHPSCSWEAVGTGVTLEGHRGRVIMSFLEAVLGWERPARK